MLQHLSINNYALIESLEIDFKEGFNVITGETGAGKSILLGGLSLVLGKRADLGSLKDASKKCIIEAVFNKHHATLNAIFDQYDLDVEETLRLRREITPSGKSRAFVNDTPVTLDVLSAVGKLLIDIHAQHETLELFNESQQLAIIDGFAVNQSLLLDYQDLLISYKKNKASLAVLEQQKQDALKDSDYKSFLFEELEAAQLLEGMQETLESQYHELSNAATIIEQLSTSIGILHHEDLGVLAQLRMLKSATTKLSEFGKDYESIRERIDSVLIELDDLHYELSRLENRVEQDPHLLESINDQLQAIYNLQKKHQVSSVEELIQIREDLRASLNFVQDSDEAIAAQKMVCDSQEKELRDRASVLRTKRKEVIPNLERELIGNLTLMGMENARFKIELLPLNEFSQTGMDAVEFLFSANSGSKFGHLKQVASGGELSRIMLSVKAILARYIALPTIIFDEIDSGVSGEISNKMALIMEQLSSMMQVFSITHLPQVAAKGTYHYKVFKQDDGTNTVTQMTPLTDSERIVELAEMLGGKQFQESAVAHAKQLLHREI